VVHGPPDPADREAFAAWLKTQREAWAASIDTSGLAWFQKAKLPLGAFSTLLWVEVSPLPKEQQQPGLFGALRLRSYAIGDSCLFHVRHGELLRCFPLESAEQFQADPLVLGSVDLKRDGLISFSRLEEYCFPDDLVVLCTDAIAEWAVRRQQSGDPPEWMRYWYMSRWCCCTSAVSRPDRRRRSKHPAGRFISRLRLPESPSRQFPQPAPDSLEQLKDRRPPRRRVAARGLRPPRKRRLAGRRPSPPVHPRRVRPSTAAPKRPPPNCSIPSSGKLRNWARRSNAV